MLNVLVYALPNRNSGGYSVVLNLYEDIKNHQELYPDIHWYFIVGMDGFENTESITVINEDWALRTYGHRLYYNWVKVKAFVKKYDIKAVISLNMGVNGLKTPSIISLHNVLPLYHCGNKVFDRKSDMVKQFVINHMIIKSLKKAAYVLIPSEWIKDALIKKFNIEESRIYVSPIIVPEVAELLNCCSKETDKGYSHHTDKDDRINENLCFIYPSTGYPYKNHRVVVDAVKILQKEGITGFCVRFTGNVGNGKTIESIKKEINENNLAIEFSGFLSKEELVRTYKEGVLLFPSKIETDGFPLLESMACGGYIIASNLNYAKEALKPYDNYDLFDPDNPNELAALMKKTISNKCIRHNGSFGSYDIQPRTSVIVPLLMKLSNRE